MSDLLRDRVVASLGETYEVAGELGRGGMGVVYRAVDRKLRRPVAIKVLPPDLAFREDVRQRFLREAQTAAQLTHPHIVPIYAVEERDGLVCFVMALVDGDSVATHASREHLLPTGEVIGILRGVADALAYAHGRGIVHRDIKPDNILLDRQTGRAMVTDFGIARAAEGDTRLTVTGVAVGTPAYMSPEQAMGEREIDGRSDVYSLAIVGYQLLSGELPHRATNTPAMLMKHISERPRPLHELRPALPPTLVAVVERAMAKKPSERWSGAAEFRDALDQALAAGDGRAGPHASSRERAASDRAQQERQPHDASLPRPRGGAEPVGVRPEPSPPPSERPSSAWKRPAPRDAIEAANAGWRPPRALRSDRPPQPALPPLPPLPALPALAPLPPVPAWMPASWREVRRRGVEESAGVGRRNDRAMARATESRALEGRSIGDRIRALRRRTASTVVTIGTLATVNLLTTDVPWVIFPAFFLGVGLLRGGSSLWADGVRWKDVFGRGARAAMQRHAGGGGGTGAGGSGGAGTDAATADGYAETLVGRDVLRGPYGARVRRAASDRTAVHEVLASLTPADKELIPDVAPTVDALAGRVGSLAQALHRLDEDVHPEALEELDRRIAALRGAIGEQGGRTPGEPGDPSAVELALDGDLADGASREGDRQLQLLVRQRSTIADLLGRRATLVTQLESASLMLQNMRLDMIALRSAGVQSAMDDVSSATQEARALSRDIAHVLDAARQVR